MLKFHVLSGKGLFTRCYRVMDKFVTRIPRSGGAADTVTQADSGGKSEKPAPAQPQPQEGGTRSPTRSQTLSQDTSGSDASASATSTGTASGKTAKSDSPSEVMESDAVSDSDLVQAARVAEENDTRSPTHSATKSKAFQFVEKKGDLFSCGPDQALAHCISADVRMGKGIAVIFKRKFGGVQELLAQGQRSGGLATLKRDGRYIYYLVTKEKYHHKPTYDNMHKSLKAMHRHCTDHGVEKLSMPMIGCGLDGLKWPKVMNIIKDVFKDTDMIVTIYTL